jgi:hypothetical protein
MMHIARIIAIISAVIATLLALLSVSMTDPENS